MKLLRYKNDIIRFKMSTNKIYEININDISTTKRAWHIKKGQWRLLTNEEIGELAQLMIRGNNK